MDGRHLALIFGLLPACADAEIERPARPRLLPAYLSLVVERLDGSHASLLLPLKRNGRDQLDIRVFEGSRLYDGRQVFEFDERPEGIVVHNLVLHQAVPLQVDGPIELIGAHQGYAWVSGPDGIARCHLGSGVCQGADAMPELALEHPGPFNGFRVSLSGGVVRVLLPRMTQARPVYDGASKLLSVHWVRGEEPKARAVVDATFRGQASLVAAAQPCELDGSFDDWGAPPVAVVENPWQLQAGGAGWRGERDASFGVVASWTAERVCFAGRVRDDVIGVGDLVRLQVDSETLDVPLVGPLPDAARRGAAWYGVNYEACFDASTLPPRGDLDFRASLVDVDPGEPTTVLATAPEIEGRPLGHLVLQTPDGLDAPRVRAASTGGPRAARAPGPAPP